MRRKISPKFHVKNGVKNGNFHAHFTLLARSAEFLVPTVTVQFSAVEPSNQLRLEERNERGKTKLRGIWISKPLGASLFNPSFQQLGVSDTPSQEEALFFLLGPEKVFPRICLPKFLAKFR